MVVQKILVLSLFITQALCAPSGCIESCTYIKQHESQTANIQDRAGLSHRSTGLQGLDYSRPGTWSEHNDYNTDNGHGKVHEERGQVIDGSKTVRFYKRNYTSSYGTGNSYGGGLLDMQHQNNRHTIHIPNTDEMLNSQRLYSQVGNLESTAQEQKYGKEIRHTQSSFRSTNEHNARLEDFGEYSGSSRASQSSVSDSDQRDYTINRNPTNWSKVDSYKTDGGHGRVFEEEGQYTAGPKKIRYFRRNYTSSYSSPDSIPVSDIERIGVRDIHRELVELNKKLEKEYNQMSTAELIGHSNVGQAHSVNSNYRYRDNYDNSRYQNGNDQFRSSTNEDSSYINPSQNMHDRSSYNTYERHEGHVTKMQSGSQLINPTSGYTSVIDAGNTGYHRNVFGETNSHQETDNVQQAALLDDHHSKFAQNQRYLDNLRGSASMETSAINLGTPEQQSHYEEHHSSHHIQQSSVPQHSTDTLYANQNMNQYSNNQYKSRYNSYQAMQHPDSYVHQSKDDGVRSTKKTYLGKLITGALDSGQGEDTLDCGYVSDQTFGNSQDQHKFKRSAKYNDQYRMQQTGNLQLDQDSQQYYHPWEASSDNQKVEDLTQQTEELDDSLQQTSGKLEYGQESQQTYQPWKRSSDNQKVEDLTQQTGELDDLSQQTSGKLEFGQESQQSYQPWETSSDNQKVEDLTQQTDELDDLLQQTSGKLEFGQESQQTYQPWKPSSDNQKVEDLTQQTGELDDLSQQTSGKLEFGQESQQSYQPWETPSDNQKVEGLTQQTGELDDLSQQTSGKLEFGQESQQSYQPWETPSDNQKVEGLTQQTGELDDLSQQTSGKLEFGQESQQSYQPWETPSDNQKVEDLTKQTGKLDDLSQQTSGKLEFNQESQQTYQPWKPSNDNQKVEDLTQQTGKLNDLSQQASGKLEFGQESQQTYQPWKPTSDNQKLDVTQQTGELDDLSQQTSGKLEFGQDSQQTYQPWKPNSDNQKLDVTQQTGELDDLSQQTSGKLEFGQDSQQTYQPWKPNSDNQKLDVTQQTGELDDLSQQTSEKLEFGQDSQQTYQPWKPNSDNQKVDLTQQTDQLDDLSQHTSGKLEFGQESQQSYQPWETPSDNQKVEDLTQQTGNLDDLSQHTSGKLEFAQESQQSSQTWEPSSDNQKVEDLTQQTDQLDDLSQQAAGKLEFGQESQQTYQPWKPYSDNQKLGATQQTGKLEDLSQQTSGKLEFEQDSQQTYQPWRPSNDNQKVEDLTQQTDQLDGLSQQASGKLEFGQESQQTYQPWKPSSDNEKGDLTQQIGQLHDISQQTSGKFKISQESQEFYQPWKPYGDSQKDLSQQTFGKLEFGQESQQMYHPWELSNNDKNLDVFQQTDDVSPQEGHDSHPLKPAEKPKSRLEYLRRGSTINQHIATGKNLNNPNEAVPIIYELPPQVGTEGNTHSIWNQNMGENPNLQSSTDKDNSETFLYKRPETAGYDVEGGNVDQVNWLHKSNDATVGLQWHYTYHPSDQRQFVQQTDQKHKEGMQEQTNQDNLSHLHQVTDQEIQSKYSLEDSHQQSGSNWQSYNHASEGVKTTRRKFSNLQQQNKLTSNQHVPSENLEGQSNIPSSETHKLEPRILEAYGGGAYDPHHPDNLYSGVRVNPSATLPPTNNEDSWYIREKPSEILTTTEESTSPPSSVEPLDIENPDSNETTPTSVWSRIGNKITSTIDKAKEKAKLIFG